MIFEIEYATQETILALTNHQPSMSENMHIMDINDTSQQVFNSNSIDVNAIVKCKGSTTYRGLANFLVSDTTSRCRGLT